jgi:chromosomal replication initiation ATPase DnaA
MAPSAQLPLRLDHRPEYGLESFIPAPSNRDALELVRRWPDWPAPVVALCGPAGSGKTHLSCALCMISQVKILKTADLSRMNAQEILASGAAIFEGADEPGLPEAELFHLINATRESGATLLLTARTLPADWPVTLPDLRSRLRMAAPVVLAPPEDDLIRQVLVKLLADRQILVDRAVIDYILPRMERSLSAAAKIVEVLDQEGLSAGRAITRPMAAEVLRRIGNDFDAIARDT